MKGAVLAILLILAAVSADVAVAHRPWFPWHHPVPGWPWNPEVKKCLSDFPEVHRCLIEVYKSYDKDEIHVSSECCEAIDQMNADCASTILSKFKSPFYKLVSEKCSSAPPVEPPVDYFS